MENVELDLLPREETLVRLYELRDRFGLVAASQLGARSEAERHLLDTGHRLAFGCCREDGASSRHTR